MQHTKESQIQQLSSFISWTVEIKKSDLEHFRPENIQTCDWVAPCMVFWVLEHLPTDWTLQLFPKLLLYQQGSLKNLETRGHNPGRLKPLRTGGQGTCQNQNLITEPLGVPLQLQAMVGEDWFLLFKGPRLSPGYREKVGTSLLVEHTWKCLKTLKEW